LTLAQTAGLSGDAVAAQNHDQHAEHFQNDETTGRIAVDTSIEG
jgi:hypothetical protein